MPKPFGLLLPKLDSLQAGEGYWMTNSTTSVLRRSGIATQGTGTPGLSWQNNTEQKNEDLDAFLLFFCPSIFLSNGNL